MSAQSSRRKRGHRPEDVIVKAVIEMGPRNLSSIAKATGIPVETVRYKLKRQLTALGFRVRAEPSYSKLGLKLYHATFTFSEDGVVDQALQVFSSKGYMVRSVKLLPQGIVSAEFALPSGSFEKCSLLLKHLVKVKMLSKFDLEEIAFSNEYSTNADYFDFKLTSWKIDWSSIPARAPAQVTKTNQKGRVDADVDRYDIILVEELQRDATQHVSDIAEKMNIATPVLGYHYRTHFRKKGLVSAYITRWIPGLTEPSREPVLLTRLQFRGLRGKQVEEAHSCISRIPFIWSEYATTARSYVAYLSVPSSHAVNMMQYLKEQLPELREKVEISFSPAQDISRTPVPHQLFSEKKWVYDVDAIKDELLKLKS